MLPPTVLLMWRPKAPHTGAGVETLSLPKGSPSVATSVSNRLQSVQRRMFHAKFDGAHRPRRVYDAQEGRRDSLPRRYLLGKLLRLLHLLRREWARGALGPEYIELFVGRSKRPRG